MSAERCKHEMLPGQCGDCRGLKSVEEQTAADVEQLRARLLSGSDGHHWWAAKYSGRCAGCREWFPVDAAIRTNGKDNGFIAECCAEGDDDGLW